MGLFRHIVEQRVLANLLFFVLLVAGFMVVGNMPVEEYPNVSLDKVLITVPWPGAAPEEIERLVAKKVEEKVEEIQGIEWVQASSYPDRCEVWLKIRSDSDFQTIYRDIQTEISKLRDLPADAHDPIVTKIDIEEMGPVLQIVVGWAGDKTSGLNNHDIEGILRSHTLALDVLLEQDVPDLKKVRVYGNRDRELKILVNPDLLLHYRVTISEVAHALKARNINVPAGTLKGSGREIMVRSSSELESLDAFKEVVLRADETGPTVRLGDVSKIEWDFERGAVWSRFRGQVCLTLAVVKEDSSNAINVAKKTREVVAKFKEKAHDKVTFDVVADTTIRVRERVAVLGWNIFLGLILVLVVLWMSIGFKNAILGSLGIPFSFLVTLILLKWGGESINVISLFSMVIVLGVIVDDALVVLENIHRHFEMGKEFKEAVIHGASEVAVPVISATLTTIAAFLPLLLMPGTTGRFFAIIPKTVAYALLASLFECLLILPIHILDLGPSKKPANQQPSRFLTGMRTVYQSALKLCLRLRYLSIILLFVMTMGALFVLTRIPILFFPSDFKQFFVNITMPVGTSLEETEKTALRIGRIVDGMPKEEIESGLINVGMFFDSNYKIHTESHFAQVFVTTARGRLKTLSVQEIMAKVRLKIAEKKLVNAKIEVAELSDGPPVGKPITVRLRGNNLGRLWGRSQEVMDILQRIPGVSNVDSDFTLGKDELHFKLLDDAG
ncbi:MAG: efflux RND transporter permease subunit, partial [Verrucomicrobia bacterium]|nr:efflux RND transporter permease subunit [Verrucomicrobiota bacterium]